jgi:thymidylate synthase
MNKLDLDYQKLLKDILDNGHQKGDRTGTGTISVFGRQIRHKMSEGFPLLTTKKMYFKGIVTELIWFLRGDTNIKFLVDNNCHIWDGDVYKRFLNETIKIEPVESKERAIAQLLNSKESKEEFINRIKTDDEFAKKWGELGPIYGKQWRRWTKKKMWLSTDGSYENIYDEMDQTVIDQISILINDLKTNPDSRRLMVSAWNVGELDSMVLPPCHYGFQVYTRELSEQERMDLYNKSNWNKDIFPSDVCGWNRLLDSYNIPTRAISLMWNQRSVDTFLGLPFNIASYGLLLEIIGKVVNMVPEELIGNLGDVHLYSNHREQAEEQIGRELRIDERVCKIYENHKLDVSVLKEGMTDLELSDICDKFGISKRSREPFSLPKLEINTNNKNWDVLSIDEIIDSLDIDLTFKIVDYESHPSIKATLSN